MSSAWNPPVKSFDGAVGIRADVYRASRKAVSPLLMAGFGWIAEWHFIGPGDAPATINAALIGAGLIFPRSGLVV